MYVCLTCWFHLLQILQTFLDFLSVNEKKVRACLCDLKGEKGVIYKLKKGICKAVIRAFS